MTGWVSGQRNFALLVVRDVACKSHDVHLTGYETKRISTASRSLCHMYDGVYFYWARTEVVPGRGLPVATESWQLNSSPRSHFAIHFFFPESCPCRLLGSVTRAPSRMARHFRPGELRLLLFPPWQEAALPAPLFSSDHPLAEAFLLPAMERGCTMDYLNSSAQASAVHNACQGLWSTHTCLPGL